jgi:hypothetical protein
MKACWNSGPFDGIDTHDPAEWANNGDNNDIMRFTGAENSRDTK